MQKKMAKTPLTFKVIMKILFGSKKYIFISIETEEQSNAETVVSVEIYTNNLKEDATLNIVGSVYEQLSLNKEIEEGLRVSNN